jgi:hypothetical protein
VIGQQIGAVDFGTILSVIKYLLDVDNIGTLLAIDLETSKFLW